VSPTGALAVVLRRYLSRVALEVNSETLQRSSAAACGCDVILVLVLHWLDIGDMITIEGDYKHVTAQTGRILRAVRSLLYVFQITRHNSLLLKM
jgi:hypothetical protein